MREDMEKVSFGETDIWFRKFTQFIGNNCFY